MPRGAIQLGLAGAIAVALSTAWGASFARRGEAQGSTPAAAATPSCEIEGVERIVAVGDVHGAYERFVEVLQTAGILDGRLQYIRRIGRYQAGLFLEIYNLANHVNFGNPLGTRNSSLFLVPTVFSLVHARDQQKPVASQPLSPSHA